MYQPKERVLRVTRLREDLPLQGQSFFLALASTRWPSQRLFCIAKALEVDADLAERLGGTPLYGQYVSMELECFLVVRDGFVKRAGVAAEVSTPKERPRQRPLVSRRASGLCQAIPADFAALVEASSGRFLPSQLDFETT
jgi:hypothetical protein